MGIAGLILLMLILARVHYYRSAMLALPNGRYGGYSLHEDPSMIVERTKEHRAGYAGGQPGSRLNGASRTTTGLKTVDR
jgi:hypothetical protein